MNKCKRMFVVIILLFLNGLSSANENSMTARVMFEKAASSPSVPGISVAIANKDGIIWSEGFGYSDLENEVAMTKNTKLRIGSIAKVITAAGLMRLYDQGKIDLDDDIRGLVSEWPKKHEKITLRQLTSHTSGIRHYKSEEEFLSNVKYKNTIDALNIFKDDQLEFKPGTEFGYSTFAWTLVSAVIEKAVVAKDFKSIIRDEVIVPLEMRNTTFDDKSVLIKNRQRPYSYIDGQLLNSQEVDVSCKYAGGGFLSTASEISSFAMAHTKSTFLKSETLEMMFEKAKLQDGSESAFGIGWGIGFERRLQRAKDDVEINREIIRIMTEHPNSVMHSGGSVGGTTMMILCLEHKHSVTVVKNVDQESTANVFELALRTLDIFHQRI